MDQPPDPYDEFPYRSSPIPWSAPERLALASLLHGGPRTPRVGYRMLELACGDGTNLLALAGARRHATFVGVDGGKDHIASAQARARELGLDNVAFVRADLRALGGHLDGRFDYIAAHGVVSWVADDVRDAILRIHREALVPGGLVYLNYNAQPGWSVRGLVRGLLLAQTDATAGLVARTAAAQRLAGSLAEVLARSEHAWSQLLAGELRLVVDAEPSYVAHEYLVADNRAYWRSEFRALVAGFGLEIVADADFDRHGGRTDTTLDEWLATLGLVGELEDVGDLVRYRQLHSPILTAQPWTPSPPTPAEIGALVVSSPLVPTSDEPGLPARFHHPSGQEVEVTTVAMYDGLVTLGRNEAEDLRVDEVFAEPGEVFDDLLLMHRFGLVCLRYAPSDT